MVKPLSDREKKKIAKKANAQSKASSQKTTSGSSSSSGIYNNSARKSARQAETGRTPTTTKSNSSSRGSGFEPDSVARSGKTRSQLLSELDRKYGQDFSKKDIHDGNRDFLDRIDNLTTKARFNRQVRNNEKEAQYNHNLMALQRRNDLDQLAAAGQKKFANGAFDLTSMTGKTAEEQGVVRETRDDVFHQNIYDYMTPQQRSTYEAFIGLGDRQSAKKYLASIEDGLQQQAAQKLTETIQPGNIENIQDFADVTRLGVRSGVDKFETAMQQLTNSDAVAKNYTETAFEEARKNMSGATGVVADLANTVGFMLLPVGGSLVLGLAGGAGLAGSAGVKALSASLFGAASGGSTYNDMLKENPGADKFDAKVYSIINGALEGSLQYALGGIGKLGVGGITKATGKSISGAVAKKLANVSKAAANTPAVKGLIKALVGGGKWASGASDEALEEWLQAVLDPVVRNYVLDENNEVQLFGEDQLYAAFLGALGATVMNAPSNISDTVNAQQVLEETVAKQEAKAAGKAGKPAKPYTTQSTSDQLAAYADDPVVVKLQQQIEELEEQYATEKKRHQPAIQENINKFRRALDTYIKEKEAKQTEAQEPKEVPAENAAGIPGPPPAPVQENTSAATEKTTKGKKNRPLTSEEIDQEIARLTGEVEPVGTKETVVPERTRPEFESSQMSGQEGLDFIRNSVYNNRWQGMIEEQNAENYRNNPGINLIINGVKQLNSSLTDEQAIQVAQELQAESIERGGFGENGVDANSLVNTLLEMANEAEETGEPLSPGLQLIVDSIQKRQDEEAILRAEAQARAAIDGSGLITNAVNPTPTNNVTIPQRRGLTPAQQRANNQRQQQANPRFLPPMPRFEDQQQATEAPAEAQSPVNQGLDLIAQGLSIAPYMEASQANRQKINEGVARNYTPVQQQNETTAAEDLQEAIEKAKDEQLSSEEIQSIIDEQLNEGDQTARQALSEANTRAEQAATAEMYRRAMTYLQYQKERMGLAEYNKQAQALEDAYRANATAAGVSNAEMEAVLNGSYDPRYSLNTNEEELTENEQVDRLIDALIARLEGRGALNSFERTNMPEGAEGRQFGRSIEVNEELKGTTREANAVFHEVGHLAARYDKNLVHDVIAYMRKQGMDVDSMVEERRQSYREDFEAFGLPFPENADTAYFEEEVMSKYLGEEAEKDPEILNKIAKDEPGLLQRILDMLRRLVDTFTGKQKSDCEFYIDRINNALSRANATTDIDTTERRLFGGKKALKASRARYEMALKMYRADANPDSIWEKTGWLLGPDGHWRFEIDDSKLEFDPNGRANFNKPPRLEALEKGLMDPDTGKVLLSDEEYEEYKQLEHEYITAQKEWDRTHSEEERTKLSDWIRHDELFENYPDLKDVGFKWDKLGPGTFGQYDPSGDTIVINDILRFAPVSTILHEIQHAIQEREDFARGASPEYWQNKINKGENPRRSFQWQDDYIKAMFHKRDLDAQHPGIKEDFDELEEIMRPAIDDDLPELSPDEQLATEIRWQNKRNELISKYGEDVVNDYELTSMLAEPENPKHLSSSVLYENTAGEQESREVQNRMRMTRSQRKFNTPNIGGYDTVFTDGSTVYDPNYYYTRDDIDDFYYTRDDIDDDIDDEEENSWYNEQRPISRGNTQSSRSSQSPIDAEGVVLSDGQLNYFKDSKARDDEGRLIVFYHGGQKGQTIFDGRGRASESQMGKGYARAIYLTDNPSVARAYSGDTRELYANITNPLILDAEGRNYTDIPIPDDAPQSLKDYFYDTADADNLANYAYENGYDGVIIKNVREGVGGGPMTEAIAFDSEQVKDTNNENPTPHKDVRYSFNRNKDKGPKAEHKTSQKQGDLITELGEEVKELSDEDKFYTQKAMTETYQEASDRIKKKGGVDKVYASLMSTRDWNAKQMNEATVILSRLSRGGDSRSTQALLPKYLEQQKNLGQAINAFKLLRRYMPDAVASITQSIARDLNVELTQEELDDIKLCDEIIQDGFISRSVRERASSTLSEWLTDASKYVNRNQLDAETAAYAAAMTLVTSKQPATARQKFRALQRISLLSNPKTHFRNILGNLAEQAGSVMSRPAADATDRFMAKITGQRTFGSGGGHAFARAVADSLERAVMDNALGINTVGNKFDEDTTDRNNLAQLVRQSAFDEHTQNAIRNGINKAANDIDKLIGLGLSLGDAPFLIGTYESALEQIMNANPDLLVDGEATAEMMDTAWDVAFRRTFRDNNAVVKSLSRIRNAIPFGGETIAPYVQTPVNVVLTAIQYSPIGFGEAICKAFLGENSMRVKLDKGESTMKVQRQIAELVGRGALGTACMLIGAVLASAGKITGDDDDIDSQKEKNWNTATGRRGSSIKVGDTYIDPSSLQSLSTPIMAGAAAYQSGRDENDETNRIIDILAAAAKASMKMGNTMLEMPVLQGVSDLFSGNYDNGEILAGALGLAGNAITQVVPFGSLLKQAGKAVDPYSRAQSEINTKGPGERVLKSTVNNLKTMTPWTRETLPERYDVLGNPIKNDASEGALGRIYNSFLNPFSTSKENANEVTDEIDRLYAALKDTDVLPTAAGNSISYGGEKYKFNAAEKQEYQRIEGESNSEILSSLVNSEAYDRLSDEEKGKILENVYKYSANKAKAAYLEKQGVEYESDAKWMDSIDAIVESGVDIGDAIIYRYEISNINNNHDEQVHYINSLPLTASQKEVLDDAFVDKYWPGKYIDEDRDYTNADTLALSMTSDSGREKYKNRFSGTWRGVSGNTYSGMTGEEFGLFYDAYNEGSNAAEKVEAIKQMLMEEFNLDESSAYTMAYDFRKYYAAKYD